MAGERGAAERLWLLGGVLAVGLTAVVGWFMIVRPEMAKASDTRDATSLAQTSNLILQNHVDGLRGQADQLTTLTNQLRTMNAALPATSSIDAFTRELSTDAQADHVRLTSITVGDPTPTDPTGSATTPAAPPAAGAPAAPPAGVAVVGRTYSINVAVVSSGAIAAEQSFLHSVQNGPRAVLVTSSALAPPDPTAGAGTATLTIELQVFVEPQSPQDQAQLQKLLDAAATK